MSGITRKTIVTHNGSFHPDDVFAVATISLIEKLPTILRTRDKELIDHGHYVVDVGGVHNPSKNRFDHHQEGGAGERKNGIPYASFGLVWKKYGAWICGDNQAFADSIDERLVTYIDAMDNGVDLIKPLYEGVYPYMLNNVIFSYLPSWKEKEKDESSLDRRFLEAVSFAKGLLKREVIKMKDYDAGKAQVLKTYQKTADKRVIVLERDYPWGEVLSQCPEPLFAIYPQEHSWHVKAVRDDMKSFKSRAEFPKKWAGKKGSELAEISGVSDAVFCHNKRFMAVAESQKGAIELAQRALGRKK